MKLLLIQPGKPTRNAYVASFSGKFRHQSRNEHWFVSVTHAQATMAVLRHDYHAQRPYTALGYRTSAEVSALHRQHPTGCVSTVTIG